MCQVWISSLGGLAVEVYIRSEPISHRKTQTTAEKQTTSNTGKLKHSLLLSFLKCTFTLQVLMFRDMVQHFKLMCVFWTQIFFFVKLSMKLFPLNDCSS